MTQLPYSPIMRASGGSADAANGPDPAASTLNAIARWADTGGRDLKDSSGATVSDNFVLNLTGATLTASEPNTFAQTWNNGAVTFNLLSVEATDTASGAASLLQRWRVGGANVAALDKTGNLAVVKATVNGGTVTASSAALSVNQTWNNAGVTFAAAVVNVTNTASAAASLLLDLQVGGTSQFAIRRSGQLDVPGDWTINVPIGNSLIINAGSVALASSSALRGGSAGSIGLSTDVTLRRDAADTLALRNSTTSQTFNVYDTQTSSTDYHRLAIKTARATLASVSGASVTATGLIPGGAIVVGVTSKVTVALGGGGGTTGYQVGDAGDADRWGAAATITLGTTTDNRDWTATTVQAFTAATDVIVTAVGGNFNGTGTIYLSVQYLIGQAD